VLFTAKRSSQGQIIVPSDGFTLLLNNRTMDSDGLTEIKHRIALLRALRNGVTDVDDGRNFGVQ
jgi:hypothetical protein